ncbi:DUF2314 domain-containing protein [Calycomorphotria hydatis]|uniref:DUF2314 domain-containing protein n=1 Tax=Calycomorphotria hydatis TaxID=2528027 RepID=A0A517TBI2_9PLAN|nr:DUF2314 domain-containing protein [Calycomorphotria hydatis]QDT65732.1 hypothetical protein V22_29920 [Calycomorphotria hydatis]
MTDQNSVFFHKGDDPEIVAAAQKAQQSFKHFWYQVALDFNRIIPALQLSCIKVPFSDSNFENEDVEQMWCSEINFDGLEISAVLLNSPNWLKSVQEGDEVHIPVSRIRDWLCVLEDKVYGGYSIQVLRQQMSSEERASHDKAWGLNFPSPETVDLPPHNEKFESGLAQMLADEVKKDSFDINAQHQEGRTLLHMEALFGRQIILDALLAYEADKTIKCDRGWTAADYARHVGWSKISEMLS